METQSKLESGTDSQFSTNPNQNWIIKLLIKNIRTLGILITLFSLGLIYYLVISFKTFSISPTVDIFGSILGIIGVLVGLITVAYVERNNETRLRESDALLNNIQSYTTDIHEKLHSLDLLEETEKRFAAIEEVISKSKLGDNKLYMVSYGVKYGQFLLTNLKVIEEHKHIEVNAKTIKAKDIYKCADDLKDLCSSIEEGIDLLAKDQKLNIACLKREKYKHFVRSRVLKNKKVILATDHQRIHVTQEYSDQNGNNICLGPNDEWNNVFIYNLNGHGKDNEERTEMLIQEITDIDFRFRDSMFEDLTSETGAAPQGWYTSKNQLNELEYIPFQFFLCAPIGDGKKDQKTSGWDAVVVYTDYNNIGKKNSVVSFRTNHQFFCRGLLDTYEELVTSNKAKDRSIAFLKNCFYSSSQINFVNNVMSSRDGSGNPVEVIAKDDIFAKEFLVQTFKELDQQFTSDSLFIKENEPIIDTTDFFKSTSFSIGLFHNTFTMLLCSLFQQSQNAVNGDFSFFRLIPREKDEAKVDNALDRFNRIEILNEAENRLVANNYENGFTHAILTRMKYAGKWTFVFGGFDAFGTSKIKACIDELNKQMLESTFDNTFVIGEVTPYIALFAINTKSEASTAKPVFIESITILDEKKKIRTKTNFS